MPQHVQWQAEEVHLCDRLQAAKQAKSKVIEARRSKRQSAAGESIRQAAPPQPELKAKRPPQPEQVRAYHDALRSNSSSVAVEMHKRAMLVEAQKSQREVRARQASEEKERRAAAALQQAEARKADMARVVAEERARRRAELEAKREAAEKVRHEAEEAARRQAAEAEEERLQQKAEERAREIVALREAEQAAHEEAEAAMLAGHEANRIGAHALARSAFCKACALQPRPAALVSAANMALKLGDAATAAAEYEALLATTEGPHAPSDAVRAAAIRKLGEARQAMA